VLEILHHSGCDSCWYIGDFSSARTFWTLPIEWWIYVTFGIIFFSIKDRYWTRLRLIVLGLASLYPLYHFIARFSGNLTGVWMMGLGASALYYWVETAQIDKSSDRPWILRIALFLMVLAVPMGLARLAFAQFNAYDMAFTTLLAIMVFAPLFVLKLHPVRLSKILRLTAHHLASYSYTLYLIHTTLMIAVVTLHREWITDTTDLILLLIAINLISFCFAHVFELHYHDVARYLKALFRSEEAVRRSKPRAQVVLPADALTAPDLKPSPIAAVALWDGSQESKSGSSFTRRTET
jgi:peptidoglycan/LPS O-acetylase OafA/YrhL